MGDHSRGSQVKFSPTCMNTTEGCKFKTSSNCSRTSSGSSSVDAMHRNPSLIQTQLAIHRRLALHKLLETANIGVAKDADADGILCNGLINRCHAAQTHHNVMTTVTMLYSTKNKSSTLHLQTYKATDSVTSSSMEIMCHLHSN